MKAALAKWLDEIRSSYWFVPALMVSVSIGLALGLTTLDEILGAKGMDDAAWLLNHRPEGARALLAAIAGSMITVAGVTFSVTITTVVNAAAQFGPRLLTNFMRDRGNQITLGTFISAFVYCLLVLRSVRSADETIGSDAAGGFVPQLAMLGALGFALAGVAMLIYFVHHVPASVHISHVIARIGAELSAQIDWLYPLPQRASEAEDTNAAHTAPAEHVLREQVAIATPIDSQRDGYLQHLYGQGLLSAATDHDLRIFVVCQPGDFVIARRPLVYVWPALRLKQDAAERIRNCFAFGSQRTQAQDLMFLLQELVEIAVRALSPGVNDPVTAIKCMDWLAAAMSNMARRQHPDPFRFDDSGELRVVYQPSDFAALLGTVCEGLRPHAARDPQAAVYMLQSLGAVAPDVLAASDREALLQHVNLVNDSARRELQHEADREVLGRAYQRALALIRDAGRHEHSRLIGALAGGAP